VLLAFADTCGAGLSTPDSGTSPSDAGAAVDAAARVDAGMPDAGMPPPEDLEGFVAYQMEAGGLPAVGLALIVDGELVVSSVQGWQDVERGIPADEHTSFAVGSVSKLFTAVPVMHHVELGELDLDAALDDILGYPVRHPDHDVPITTRMLLTHTSGIIDNWVQIGATTSPDVPEISLGELTAGYVQPEGAYSSSQNWGAAPGTDFDYSNMAVAIAAHVAEVVGGESFHDQTDALVFEPLGLDDTGWYPSDVPEEHLAVPYTWSEPRDSFVALDQATGANYPAGSLRASVTDLVTLMETLLAGGPPLFTEARLQAMLELQVPELDGRQGLVFRYRSIGDRRYVGHSGSTIGGSAQLLLRFEERSGLLLVTNGDPYIRSRIGIDTSGGEAMDAILRRLDRELVERIGE